MKNKPKEIQELLARIETRVRTYKYRPIPITFFEDVRTEYRQLLPDWCKEDGDACLLQDDNGADICDGYTRIVIGDYGAYVEFSTEQACEEAFVCQPGQEYRQEERYQHCKYLWMTTRSGSGIKIYRQQHTVSYADYRPGMYYVSVYDVQPASET